ncbi:MAG: hypothetical protein M1814_000497 [Vezdaea aestivalis]|nr:MAG: hypothetical protein M1814_000497 [Vezdaea aestivalis]
MPTKTWKDSGAAKFLNKFIKDNGDADWSNKIDRLNKEPKQISILHCFNLDSGYCPPPDTGHLSNIFTTYPILDSQRCGFMVDKLVEDFSERFPENSKMWTLLSAAFSFASGIGAASSKITGPTAMMSTILALVDQTEETQEVMNPNGYTIM